MAEDVIESEHLDIPLREDEEMVFFTELALHEAERWIQVVTRKKFQYPDDFRKSLMNGILLCELLNCIKPGSVKRINKLPGPIASLDNVNVFLQACAKSFGLNDTHLFDPSDLEDLTHRAISDEDERLLKQEVDRRALNVAITIYWLGRTVADDNKTPVLDVSAFSAIVHSHGNRSVVSIDQFSNNDWQQQESPVKITSPTGRHIRDSSYDSLGSYEPESESSFDDLDGSMPVRSDMKGDMKRYGSAGSLNRDLHLSATSDTVYSDKNDSMYQSSPDLSQGSHAHTRSSSTDSAEGGYYGNHSRQSSGSVETYPTRRTSTSAIRKTSTTTPDPLQFVKIKGAQDLAKNAEKQIEIAKEVNKMRGVVDTGGLNEEPDWQSNFKNWKSKRRQSTPAFASLGETEEEKEEKQQSVKTFKQMTQEREKRRSLGPMNFYPLEDDDFGLGSSGNTEGTITKSQNSTAESKPKGKMSKKAEVAPWARDSSGEGDSQSDSETNNSHQSGDTDSVFSDKSTDKLVPSRFVSEDDSWMKNTKANNLQSANKVNTLPRTSRPMGENVKRWETNVQDSQKKDDKKKVDLPKNSANIRNITKAYEQKDKEASAEPVVVRRRSEYSKRSSSSSSDRYDASPMTPPWKSLDLSNKSPYNNPTNKPLSPTSPALVPRDQRFSGSFNKDYSPPSKEKPFTEKFIKITQKPNNNRGFGFTLAGGMEKKQPITVQRVSLGSAADVNELEAKDEILSINGRDASSLTLAQVQAIVDHSVKRGELELMIKRYIEEEDEYDSMEEEENRTNQQSNINNTTNSNNISRNSSSGPVTDNGNSYFHYPSVDHTTPTYTRPVLQVSVNADGGRPRLMDQLVKERQQQQAQETNNNDVKIEKAKKKDEPDSAPETEVIEKMVESFSFSSQSMPKVLGLQEPVTPDMNGPPAEVVTEERSTLQMTPSRPNVPETQTVTEERPTIKATPTKPAEPSPVAPRRRRTPDRTEALKVQDSPPPPTPPKAEPPPLMQYAETPESGSGSQDSGFGPPAALLRWQRPRTKSEFTNPFPTSSVDQQLKASKRLSSTLPYNSKSPFNLEDYSKDDTNLNKVSVDADLSQSNNSLRNTYTFGDADKMEDWQQKQEQERQPESQLSFPPMELNIRREETLTAQEKFEREQARIRQQYEEEKRQAKEAEKRKQEEEQKKLNSDKFLQKLESQVLETKQESQMLNMEPIRPAPTQPKFSSEPMTIKLSKNSPGRQLIIDPRNMDDTKPESSMPQYSFHVDLQASKPPLRSLNQTPELSQEELLERERQKIREEEKRKMEEEKQRWKEEQARLMQQEQESLRLERERLHQEQERVAREKALLEQQRHQEEYQPSTYQSPHNYSYMSPPTSSSPSSSQSHSPKSPPPALDPKYKENKKVPPPTAPKPDKNMKARLTREDLMMMNRKPTPMTKRPEGSEDSPRSDLGASIREPPTKAELHSLNAVPKPKFHNSGAWIKEEEPVKEKPFVIGKRSDLIHDTTDNSNSQEHWLVREAERRRKEEQSNRMNSVTAHAGPIKPSQSSLVNHFRGDMEPPARSNRYSYPSPKSVDSHRSSPTSRLSSSGNNLNQYERSPDRNVMQFSARTQPNSYSNPSLTKTLPASFSFNANLPPSQDQPVRSSRLPPPPSGDADAVIAVSGKQQCSHCGEELGFGAAMVIESLGLYYHVQCFCCCVCRMPLGNGSEGADVRVRVNKLHCKNCYSNDEAGLKFSKV